MERRTAPDREFYGIDLKFEEVIRSRLQPFEKVSILDEGDF